MERRRRSTATRITPYDTTNPDNWTCSKLKTELERLGIRTPQGLNKQTLKSLYVSNSTINPRDVSAPNTDTITSPGPSSRVTSRTQEESNAQAIDQRALQSNMAASISEIEPETASTRSHSTSSGVLSQDSVMQAMITMQQQLLVMMRETSKQKDDQADTERNYLQEAMHHTNYNSNRIPTGTTSTTSSATTCSATTTAVSDMGTYGVAPDSLPHLDIVSASLKRAILQGKDVNLSMLLIPGYEFDKKDKGQSTCSNFSVDKRLSVNLTLAEFLTAFGKFKRIMGDVYPQRRKELDLYEGVIININNTHGDVFYDYHKLFSAKCAEALRQGTKVDWSLLDMRLFSLVTAGRKARSCELCSSVSHGTNQCEIINSSTQARYGKNFHHRESNSKDLDLRGRKRVSVEGTELCNNFNDEKGCSRTMCPFAHACSKCKNLKAKHSAVRCKNTRKD